MDTPDGSTPGNEQSALTTQVAIRFDNTAPTISGLSWTAVTVNRHRTTTSGGDVWTNETTPTFSWVGEDLARNATAASLRNRPGSGLEGTNYELAHTLVIPSVTNALPVDVPVVAFADTSTVSAGLLGPSTASFVLSGGSTPRVAALGGDGPKSLTFATVDRVGFASNPLTQQFLLDTTPPSPVTTIVVSAPTPVYGLGVARVGLRSVYTLSWPESSDASGIGGITYDMIRGANTWVDNRTPTDYTITAITAVGTQRTLTWEVQPLDSLGALSSPISPRTAPNPSINCQRVGNRVMTVVEDLAPPTPTTATITAVKGRSISGTFYTSGDFTVGWTTSTDGTGGSDLAAYAIERNGQPYTREASSVTQILEPSTLTDRAYDYTVTAEDRVTNPSEGNKPARAFLDKLPPRSIPLTTATTVNVVGTDGLPATSTQVKFTWPAASDPGTGSDPVTGSGLQNYLVFTSEAPTPLSTQVVLLAPTAYTDTRSGAQQPADGVYKFTVRAADRAWNIAQPDPQDTIPIRLDRTRPTNVATITAITTVGLGQAGMAFTSSTPRITWTTSADSGSGMTKYQVVRAGPAGSRTFHSLISASRALTDTVADAAVDGTYTYSVLGVDQVQNLGATAATTSVVYDRRPPSAPTLSFSPSPTYLRALTLTVTADFDEPIISTPVLLVSGPGKPFFSPPVVAKIHAQRFRFTTTVSGVTPQTGDSYTMTIPATSVVDRAGNRQTDRDETFGGIVDTTVPNAPVLVFSRGPAYFKAGSLSVTADFDDPLASTPTLVFSGASAGVFAPTNPAAARISDTRFVYVTTVGATTAQAGDVYLATVPKASVVDKSGNVQTAADATQTGTVDTVAPPAPSLTFSPVNPHRGGAVTITATYVEPLGNTPTLELATGPGGGSFAVGTTSKSENGKLIVYGATVAGTTVHDGTPYTATLRGGVDLSGNTQGPTAQSTGKIDTVPPQVTSLVYDDVDRLYKADPFRVTATFSEVMKLTPTITITGGSFAGTANDVVAAPMGGAGTVWTYSRTVSSSGPDDGAFTITLTATDLALNSLTGTIPSSTFDIDTVAPVAPTVLVAQNPPGMVDTVSGKAEAAALVKVYRTSAKGTPIVTGLAQAVGIGPLGDGTVTDLETSQSRAAGIAVDTDGTLYFSYEGTTARTIMRRSAGTVTPVTDVTFVYVTGLALDGKGYLYAAEYADNGASAGKIHKIRLSDGAIVRTLGGLTGPFGLAYRDGSVYFSLNDRAIVRCSAELTTASTSIYATGAGNRQIAFDSSGSLFVAGGLERVVRKVSPGGGSVTDFAGTGTQGSQPISEGTEAGAADFDTLVGLAVDGNGAVYVGDTALLYRIASGKVTRVVGDGSETDGFPASAQQTSQAWGIALDGSGTLFYTESSAGRVRQVTPAAGAQNYGPLSILDGANGIGEPTVFVTATDKAGNEGSGTSGTNDIVRPTVALTYSKPVTAVGPGTLFVTATFSEPLASVPKLTLDRPGTGDTVVNQPMSGAGDTWSYSADIPLANGGTILDGLTRATITNGLDAASNPNQVATNDTFTVDTALPVATLTFSKGPAYVNGGTLTVTADYNEAMSSLVTPTLTFSGIAAVANNFSTLTPPAVRVSTTRYQFTVTVTGTTPQEGNGFTALLAGGQDLATNVPANATQSGIVDVTTPVGTLTFSRSPANINAGSLTVTADYNEPMSSAVTPTLTFGGAAAAASNFSTVTPVATRISSTRYQYTANVQGGTPQTGNAYTATLSGGKDLASNVQDNTIESGMVDLTAPTGNLSFSKVPANINAGTLTVTADFNEPMSSAVTPTLTFSGAAATANNFDKVVPDASRISSTRYQYTVNVEGATPQTGNAYVATLSGGQDLAGNAPANATQSGFIDETAPAGTLSFSKVPANINAGTLTVTADFNEPMSSAVTPTLTFSGAAATASNFNSVTPAASRISSTRYQFTVTVQGTTPQEGNAYTATLSGGQDLASNGAVNSPQSGMIDERAPTGTLSFSEGPTYINAGSLTVTADYNEPMSSTVTPTLTFSGAAATASNFSTVTPAASRISSTRYQYTVTVQGTTPQLGNAYTATLALGKDLALNAQGNRVQSGTIDVTVPVATLSFSKTFASINAGSLTVTADYNEPMSSAVTPTLTFSGAAATASNFSTLTPAPARISSTRYQYTVNVQGSTLQEGNAYTATVSGGQDLAANPPAAASKNGMIDTAPPVGTLTFSKGPFYVNGGTFKITADYNEAMSSAVTPTLVFSGAAIPDHVSNVTPTAARISSTRYEYTVNVQGTTAATGEAYLATLSGGQDLAGNAPGSATQNGVFDTVAPTATLEFSHTNRIYKDEVYTLTATFSEDITAASPTIVISGGTGGGQNDIALTPMSPGANRTKWTFSADVNNSDEGTFTATLAGSDAAGNSLSVQPSPNSFVIDTVAPAEATLTNICKTGSCQCLQWNAVSDTGSAIVQYKVYRSTSTSAFAGTDLFMTIASSRRALKFDDAPNTRYGVGAVDAAGNESPTSAISRNAATIGGCATCDNLCVPNPDEASPSASLTFSRSDRTYKSESFTVTASFSEEMAATPKIQIAGGGASASNDQTLTNMTVGSNPWTWTYTRASFTDNGVDDGTFTITLTASDLDANALTAQPGVRTFTVDTVDPVATAMTFSRGPAFINAGSLTVTANYDEAMSSTVLPTLTFTGAAATAGNFSTNTPPAVRVNSTVYEFTVTVTGTTPPAGNAYTATLSGGTDAAGNAPSNRTQSGTIDTANPTVSLSYSASFATSSPMTITATFTESVTGPPKITIDRPGTADDKSAQNMSGSGSRWTFTYSPAAQNGGSIQDGVTNVNITNAFDAAGNGNAAPSNTTFTIDTKVPSLAALQNDTYNSTTKIQCLSWSAATDDQTNIVSYHIWGYTAATGPFVEMTTSTGTSVSFNDPTNSYYKVIAEDQAGNRRAESSVEATSISSLPAGGGCP
ncbi:MAG: hypothetical protein HYY25_12455 [Candidatus Wallbacteria bacterium]|nr:hypothetical protein [Candidatus Wallbacteria bacterium]